jgi:hypothetical protein
MTVQITVPLDDAILDRARAIAAARGMTLEAYVADLVKQGLPPSPRAPADDVSSIFGLVGEGEPTVVS